MSRVYIDDHRQSRQVLEKCWQDLCAGGAPLPRSVLIKPNLVNDLPASAGVTTSLVMLQSAVDFLRTQKSVTRIAIGEAAIIETEKVFTALDIRRFARQGVEILDLSRSPRTPVELPSAALLKKFSLPSEVPGFDLIITMPKMKTHELTLVTLGLKNFFAFLSTPGRKHAHMTSIDDAIVDIYAWLTTNARVMSLIDGSVALSGKDGPIHGDPVPLGICIGSVDALAADATAARIMGADPVNVAHLSRAAARRLGAIDRIEVEGRSIASVAHPFVFPDNLNPVKKRLLRLKNRIFRNRPLLKFPSRCVRCEACVRVCPKNCVELRDRIVFDYTKCIGCLCCCEACSSGALRYKTRGDLVYRTLRGLRRILRHHN